MTELRMIVRATALVAALLGTAGARAQRRQPARPEKARSLPGADTTFEDYRTTDGKAAKNPIKAPSTISLIESFKIRNGRLYRIEAVFTGVPFRMSSQWVPAATQAK
jgi:hypothetical protein